MVLDSAKSPCIVAAAANALRQMLSGLSSGVPRSAGHQAATRQYLLQTHSHLHKAHLQTFGIALRKCGTEARATWKLILSVSWSVKPLLPLVTAVEVPHCAGQTGVVVPEAFQALKQCAEMLGDRIQPPLVEQLLQQCAKHARYGSPWPVRKQAVDALGALAASLQACCWPMVTWNVCRRCHLAVSSCPHQLSCAQQ